MFTKSASFRIGILVVLLSLANIGLAQFSGNVQGTVTDASGAVVPKVAITLHNTATAVDLHETTNDTGFYRFTSVAPGDYTVGASGTGFKSASIAVSVATQETRGVDIALALAGTGTVSVTVTGEASILNPEETRVQNTLSS